MIIISPSGNLYGSEQVLIDYLTNTRLRHYVFLPAKSILMNHLSNKVNNHILKTYNSSNLKQLYFTTAYYILTNKTTNVYINEAGHIRYLKLLARLFNKSNKFFAHIRILEDTNPDRLRKLPKNLILITVSDFMKQNLKDYECRLLYDPYPFSKREIPTLKNKNHINFGIIGRVTTTKGFEYIKKLLLSNSLIEKDYNLKFHFYGSVTDEVKKEFDDLISKLSNVQYHGFVSEKFEIYNNIDLLLHFNSNEPLGRIILEAIDFNKPFICSVSGGTGEITKLLNLEEFTIDFTKDGWITDITRLIDEIISNYDISVKKISIAKKKAQNIFSLEKYVTELESIFKT